MVGSYRQPGDAYFANMVFEVKQTPSTYGAGIGKYQRQKIFPKSETHTENGLLIISDR
jgi:hypothetical protein